MANSISLVNRVYNDDELMSINYSKKQSLSVTDLTVDTADFTVRPYLSLSFQTADQDLFMTVDDLWFETSEESNITAEITQNTPIIQSIDGSQVARWYLQSKEQIGENLYKLNAQSTLGLLTQKKHYGGVYDGVSDSAKAVNIIADICGEGFPIGLQDNLWNIKLRGWLPIATARDNLQQVLLALRCNIRTNSNGELWIENLANTPQYDIPATAIMSAGAAVKTDIPVSSITVVEHEYIKGNTETLYDSNGADTVEQTILFSDPVDASSLTAMGYTILASGANYVTLSSGNGSLSGKKYSHQTTERTRTLIANAATPNNVRVDNATLINTTNSGDILDLLEDYYSCRSTINAKVWGSLVQPGDVVNIYDPWAKVMKTSTISAVNFSASKTLMVSVSALADFTPYQTFPYTEQSILKTGTGTWTVPAGVNEVIIVLIGGGDGGNDGAQGESGWGNLWARYFSEIEIEDGQVNEQSGSPGAGGGGGASGHGGKYIKTRLTVSPGDVISYVCGAGGAVGESGIHSTLDCNDTHLDTVGGVYNSAGYQDTDGTIYCADGITGISGGAGGAAASSQVGGTGVAGESITTYSGGGGSSGIISRNVLDPPDMWYAGDYMIVAGSGGGGAANGANGEAASVPQLVKIGGTGSTANRFQVLGNGGSGANGANGAAAANYGCGGNGGNGGGGGGAPGGFSYHSDYHDPYSGRSFESYIGPGSGGSGGRGSSGGDGCLLIKYRVPEN